jgi:hypothetical protein
MTGMESYAEPAVLWRLRHPKGAAARATLIPGDPESTLVIFVDDRFERGENFREWDAALARAEEICRELQQDGWQLVED